MNVPAAPHDDWMAREELAERMIPLIGALKRERDVVTSLHGHRLLGLSATGIVEVHDRHPPGAESIGDATSSIATAEDGHIDPQHVE